MNAGTKLGTLPGAGHPHDKPSGRKVFRRRPRANALTRFIEPGRGAFEFSLALCALSMIFPWVALGAVGAAARSVRQGSRRAWLALAAAVWCFFVGLAVRAYLGVGIFP
jgi:hypothetical protein